MSTTATADLELLLHVKSIRFRLDKVLMKEHARVMSKKPGHRLCNLFEELQRDEVFIDHRIITPLRALKMVRRDIENDLFSRVEQVTTISLGRLLTKLPSS